MARRRRFPRTSRRARRALASARALDQIVADQLPLVAWLPEPNRQRTADFLAELVLLAQAYRQHAAGWISRRELERRGAGSLSRIAVIRRSRSSAPQFTERD